MSQEVTTKSQKVSRVKRWLPYMIAAAIIINTPIMAIIVDIPIIFIRSMGVSTPSIIGLDLLRMYGNVILIAGLLIISLRDVTEKKNAKN